MSVRSAEITEENGKEIGSVPPKPPSIPPAMTARVGAFGRYTLLKPLARGGMGEVYLSTSGGIEGAERPCVVKLIRREHARDKSFLARFFDEARIQAQLQHPGVAQVLEASTDQDGMPYVVLEYIEGRNLGEVRQRAAQLGVNLSWADAVAVVVSMADALAHVHERTDANGKPLQIVHRDLSPQNVMVGYGGDVKLIDFGTARGENRRCQTVAGVVFAKPGYVAPEVANATPGGAPADIYALGIILWELMMGRKFLNGEPDVHLAEVAAGRRSPTPVSLTNNVPLELDAIIGKMTAFRIEDRYQSAREVKAALLGALKRAPSLADGERGVRPRIAHLMSRLYPSEPARSRSDFAQLLAEHRRTQPGQPLIPESPSPGDVNEDQLLPGTRYRLELELAKSDMSVVWAAEHVDLGRRVALKILPKERCDDPKFERRFRSEARSLASLRHPNLVQLHDFGVSLDGRPYYAMELLSGQPLRSCMIGGPMHWSRAVDIALQVLSALSAAHGKAIIHRDIKPENVFVTTSGATKLLDFGVAQTSGEDGESEDPDRSRSLELTGTVEYMAPEQAGREPVDERADVYALGVLLYELLTGQLPYSGDSMSAILELKRRDLPTSVRRVAKDRGIPFSLDLAVLKALSPRPEDRFETASAMREALARIARSRKDGNKRPAVKASLLWASVAVFVALGIGGFRDSELDSKADMAAEVARATEVERPRPATIGMKPGDDVAEASAPDDVLAQIAPVEESTPSANEPVVADLHDSEEAADPVAEPLGASAATAPPTERADTTPARDAELEKELAHARSLMSRGSTGQQRALQLLRKLAEQHPKDPELLELWSKAAAKMKWWGESLRVAIRWAEIDPNETSHLHLARTQRLVGQRYGAIQTLERYLEQEPSSKQVASVLEQYRAPR